MGFEQDFAHTEDDQLRRRVTVALVRAARTVRGQSAATNPAHAARHTYAMQVINSPEREGRRVLWLVAALAQTGQVASGIAGDDSDLEAALLAGWDDLAGVVVP